VRVLCLAVTLLLTACGSSSGPRQQAQSEPTAEAWYGKSVDELLAIDRDAKALFQRGKSDDAAALILKGEPLSKRLLSVPRATLAATEAASDLDELYGQMLFSNRNYGWARLLFQKNLARWKYWVPRTPQSADRLKRAQSEIAECDRRLGQ